MILIKKVDVPHYLHDSEYFASLNDSDSDDGDNFEVPESCYKSDTVLRSEKDLDLLLSTLRYWCVTKVPDFLVIKLLRGVEFEVSDAVEKFGQELSSIVALVNIGHQTTFGEKVSLAIELGDLFILKTLLGLANKDSIHKRTPALPITSGTNRDGHTLRLFAYTRLRMPCNETDDSGYYDWRHLACMQAAVCGHLDILTYLHEELHCSWGVETPAAAAFGGSLSCLRYAHEQGCAWGTATCSQAAQRGHLSCLQYAREHSCVWGEDTCYQAAAHGQLACLQYAHENGCGWTYHCADIAARNGHLACLRYLHEQRCPWSYTCSYAAEFGHLDCLQYAYEHGCELWGHLSCTAAASNGHLHCLQYAHEHGCSWGLKTTTEAAAYREYACLKYCVERGCPVSMAVMAVYRQHCSDATTDPLHLVTG